MTKFTLNHIADIIGGKVVGDPDTAIQGINGIREARKGELTFLANPRYQVLLKTTQASAIIVAPGIESEKHNLIVCDNPSLAFSKVIETMLPKSEQNEIGVHSKAIVCDNANLGENITLEANCFVGNNTSIGDKTKIGVNSFIGENCKIGKECIIYPNVTIRENTIIGDNVIIHSGTVIGSDGFGFIEVEGKQVKIPQIGNVEIGNNVEIGSNVTIDRARFGTTRVGNGTKIDNLVMLAHNVEIGENCIIVAQTGIAGSTKIGNSVILAAQVGVAGHIEIGDNTVVAGRAGVTKSQPGGIIISGLPAQPHAIELKEEAARRKLPEVLKRIKDLEKKVK